MPLITIQYIDDLDIYPPPRPAPPHRAASTMGLLNDYDKRGSVIMQRPRTTSGSRFLSDQVCKVGLSTGRLVVVFSKVGLSTGRLVVVFSKVGLSTGCLVVAVVVVQGGWGLVTNTLLLMLRSGYYSIMIVRSIYGLRNANIR